MTVFKNIVFSIFLLVSIGVLLIPGNNCKASMRTKPDTLSRHIVKHDDRSMDKFKTLLIPNKHVVEKNLCITIGDQFYYLTPAGPRPNCTGAYCVEEHFEFMNKSRKDTIALEHWNGLGFFSDINQDKNIDFVFIDYQNVQPYGHNYIYQADTFEVFVKTLNRKTFQFVDLNDRAGKKYVIRIAWAGMWDKNKDEVHIIEQHWPYFVKWP